MLIDDLLKSSAPTVHIHYTSPGHILYVYLSCLQYYTVIHHAHRVVNWISQPNEFQAPIS